MYCTKCGKQTDDGAKFCEHCGNAMNVETGELKEAGAPKKNMKIIVLGAAAVIAVILAMTVFGGKTIDLSKFVTVTVSGYEGYGKAEWDFDEAAFEAKYGNKVKYTKEFKEEYAEYGEIMKAS